MTTSKPKLRTGTRMSLDEFLALGETDERMELIDGILYIMPTATKDHQFLMRWICRPIEDYLYGFDFPPAEVHHDITTILSAELQRAVEPDLVVILAGRDDIGGARWVEGVPDIVIEILSSDRNRDLVRKRQTLRRSRRPRVLDLRSPKRHRPPPRIARRRVRRASHPHRRRHPRHSVAARPVHPTGRPVRPPPAPSRTNRLQGGHHDHLQAQAPHRLTRMSVAEYLDLPDIDEYRWLELQTTESALLRCQDTVLAELPTSS